VHRPSLHAARSASAWRRPLRCPPTHWLLLALVLTVLGLALGAHGLAYQQVGGSGTPGTGDVPATGATGPVVDASTSPLQHVGPGRREVALTFEDGPDPRWTLRCWISSSATT
jgi:hypothetical protein